MPSSSLSRARAISSSRRLSPCSSVRPKLSSSATIQRRIVSRCAPSSGYSEPISSVTTSA